MQFLNKLQLSQSYDLQKRLIEECQAFKSPQMSLRHKPIAKLIIMGNTSLVFTNNSQLSDRTLINIYTQNQGIAITPIDMVSKWNFTSAISTGTTNAYMSLLLSM